MNDQPVLIQTRANGVLTLTLNRPAARNALNLDLTRALKEALLNYESDSGLRAALVTGVDPAFCAGLDLKEFSSPESPRGEVAAMIDMWPRLTKPMIAAINGPAMTGGLEIALACDFILASENARFADTHTKIGAMAGSGMGARLPDAVGQRWAKQMSFTGIPIDAATALRIGLVNEVKPHGELLGYAQALAANISALDSDLVTTQKRVIDAGARAFLAQGLLLEKEALAERKLRDGLRWTK
jgi:enoyl-CoA hydratase